MSVPSIAFSKPQQPDTGTVVLFLAESGGFGAEGVALDAATGGRLTAAISAADFKPKALATLDIIAPGVKGIDRVILVGLGNTDALTRYDWMRLGGVVEGRLLEVKAKVATILAGWAGSSAPLAAEIADLAIGLQLRGYTFDQYKTKKKDDQAPVETEITIAVEGHAAAKKAFNAKKGLAEGVNLARDLVIEPPNVLTPIAFAERAEKLERLGVEIEILTEKEMKKAGWGALLGVAQGSSNPPRVVIMRWNGAKDKLTAPIAFIGKGVTFDTGGISIKPAASMEDMKGDMGGAACVTGLFHALASRKARVNAIGAIGLVENMPDGKAQRPGDIVTSLSGQTIEIINTDAEGRLVLADVVWHVQSTYKPKLMIDLATLTGAIMVALGKHHAGLFSTSDELAERMLKAGEATGEKLWRMPLGPDYDKMIDSQFADMKNSGGRFGGSITAAQFIKRFTNDVPWAHLDIAGTAFDSPSNEISKAWGSGWGVRLLDQLVADYYEG
jgi:leucyl aminopeptidase